MAHHLLVVGVDDYRRFDQTLPAGAENSFVGPSADALWAVQTFLARGTDPDAVTLLLSPLGGAALPDDVDFPVGPATRLGLLQAVQALGQEVSAGQHHQATLVFYGRATVHPTAGLLLCPSDMTDPVVDGVSVDQLGTVFSTAAPGRVLSVFVAASPLRGVQQAPAGAPLWRVAPGWRQVEPVDADAVSAALFVTPAQPPTLAARAVESHGRQAFWRDLRDEAPSFVNAEFDFYTNGIFDWDEVNQVYTTTVLDDVSVAVLQPVTTNAVIGGFVQVEDLNGGPSLNGFESATDYWHWTGTAWPDGFRLVLATAPVELREASYSPWEVYPVSTFEFGGAETLPDPSSAGGTLYRLGRAPTNGSTTLIDAFLWYRLVADANNNLVPHQTWYALDGVLTGNRLSTSGFRWYAFSKVTSIPTEFQGVSFKKLSVSAS